MSHIKLLYFVWKFGTTNLLKRVENFVLKVRSRSHIYIIDSINFPSMKSRSLYAIINKRDGNHHPTQSKFLKLVLLLRSKTACVQNRPEHFALFYWKQNETQLSYSKKTDSSQKSPSVKIRLREAGDDASKKIYFSSLPSLNLHNIL